MVSYAQNMKKDSLYLSRKFDEQLVRWFAQDRKLPLLVKGARQVGKTESIRHFAVGRYDSLVEINFVERPEFKAIVRDGYSETAIVRNITQIDPSLRFVEGRTLLFFDELQEFPEIATAFKFLAQGGRYDVIASGSLLGVQYKRRTTRRWRWTSSCGRGTVSSRSRSRARMRAGSRCGR